MRRRNRKLNTARTKRPWVVSGRLFDGLRHLRFRRLHGALGRIRTQADTLGADKRDIMQADEAQDVLQISLLMIERFHGAVGINAAARRDDDDFLAGGQQTFGSRRTILESAFGTDDVIDPGPSGRTEYRNSTWARR